jgi:endonuclease-3
MVDKKRTAMAVQILKKTYPKARIILQYSTPWELLVSVMLSAQCTDVTVNKVTEKLFAKYKTFDAYLGADRTEFEQDIKSTGFYHNKAKNILAAAKLIKTKFKGQVPRTMEEMLTIPGVGRKTANVVLGNAYGVIGGIAVDTHVLRLSQRLHLVDPKNTDPVKVERELVASIPKKDWFRLTYLLIAHGRAVCRAQNPNCAACVVNKLCPSSRLQV